MAQGHNLIWQATLCQRQLLLLDLK